MLTGDTPRSTDASWRQFNRYWVGQLASFTGDWFSIVAFPLAALALTDSAFYVGVVEFSELVATMLLGIWLGALADRWMPRATMIAADLGRAALLTGTAVWFVVDTPPLALLPAVGFLLGCLRNLHDGAENVMVAALLPERLRVAANGRFAVSDGIGHVVGSIIAGVATAVGTGLALGIDALSFSVAAIGTLAMGRFVVRSAVVDPTPDTASAPDDAVSRAGSMTALLREIRRENGYWRILVVMAIANLVTVCFGSQFAPYATKVLHLSTAEIGLTYSLMGVGGVVVGALLGRVEQVRPVAVLGATAVIGVGVTTMGLAPSWPVALVVFFAGGGALAVGASVLGATRHLAFAVDVQGRLSMLTRLVLSATVLPGTLLAGVIAANAGSTTLYSVFGVAAIVATLLGAALGLLTQPAAGADSPAAP